jgi:hypothetical protein
VIDHYDWAGGREAMLRFGPDTGPVVIAALPLFEEANRTRTFMVSILRALAARGIASVLPDFPGTGESTAPLETVTILDMQRAYDGLVEQLRGEGRKAFAAGLRSGALLDSLGLVFGRWHLSPQDGPDLLRELTRIKQVSVGRAVPLGENWFFDERRLNNAPDPLIEIAGNMIAPDLLAELTVKTPLEGSWASPRRIVRFSTDQHAADAKFDGAPLWRRSEPGNDPALAETLAADIADWIAACDG